MQQEGWKSQVGRMMRKCCARLGMLLCDIFCHSGVLSIPFVLLCKVSIVKLTLCCFLIVIFFFREVPMIFFHDSQGPLGTKSSSLVNSEGFK